MNKFIFAIAIGFILSGCYSKCGFTDKYYCGCEEWYDSEGGYHKKCPDSFLNINIGAKIETNDK